MKFRTPSKLRAPSAAAVAVAVAVAVASFGTTTEAIAAPVQVANYANFNGMTGLSLNGSAVVLSPSPGIPKVLRLTRDKKHIFGSAWAPTKVSSTMSFNTTFVVQMKHSTVAGDGVAFVLQGSGSGLKALGGIGGGLGYSGIKPSVAVEFDTFKNPHDINGNHVDIVTGGNSEVSKVAVKAPLTLAGSTFRVTVVYNAPSKTMRVWLVPASRAGLGTLVINAKIDVAAVLGTTPANVGFTGATGSAYSTQDILNWTMTAS